VAVAKVTPQKMLWMAGYAARKKPAEGKVQELFAKALALQDEQGNKLVFVTLDLIGVPQLMRRAVAERRKRSSSCRRRIWS
jgi:neutral ceramidase